MMVRSSLLAVLVLLSVAICSSAVVLEPSIHPFVPAGWTELGRPDPNAPFSVLIGLRLANTDKLKNLLDDISDPSSPNYGSYLTLEEVQELTSPSEHQVQAVISWLSSFGNTEFRMKGLGDWMEVHSTVSVIEEMLQIQLRQYQKDHQVIVRSMDLYQVPDSVADAISIIGGINRFPPTHQLIQSQYSETKNQSKGKKFDKLSTRQSDTVCNIDGSAKVNPEVIQCLYNVTIPPTSEENLQAVASFLGQFYSPDDLSQFESTFSLPDTPIAATYGPNDANIPGIEASLDVQYLLGTTNCSVTSWVISTNGTTSSGNEPFLTFLSDLPSLPQIPYLISMSYQDYEYTVGQEYADRCNDEFMKYSSMGTTFMTGSGDWGVGCTVDSGCNYFVADFPSSSPYVVSAGATQLSGENKQTGIDFSSGGFSNYFARPSYQDQAVLQYLNGSGVSLPPSSYYNSSGRGFPDVSAVGYKFGVIVNGIIQPVAGTSASTPTFGSLLSMINSNRIASGLPTLGWVQPFLYQAAAENPTAFTDITEADKQDTGCCGYSFEVAVGWDPYTGLGTPNFGVLNDLAMSADFFPSFRV